MGASLRILTNHGWRNTTVRSRRRLIEERPMLFHCDDGFSPLVEDEGEEGSVTTTRKPTWLYF